MKKTIKRTILVATTAFALVGAGGTALAASGYITWNGSTDFQEAMEKIGLIGERSQAIKTEKEQLSIVVKEKGDAIHDKTQEIERLTKENEKLKETDVKDKDELKQAEKDMKEVNKKAEEVLKGLE